MADRIYEAGSHNTAINSTRFAGDRLAVSDGLSKVAGKMHGKCWCEASDGMSFCLAVPLETRR